MFGPATWNSLPVHVRQSLVTLKKTNKDVSVHKTPVRERETCLFTTQMSHREREGAGGGERLGGETDRQTDRDRDTEREGTQEMNYV